MENTGQRGEQLGFCSSELVLRLLLQIIYRYNYCVQYLEESALALEETFKTTGALSHINVKQKSGSEIYASEIYKA